MGKNPRPIVSAIRIQLCISNSFYESFERVGVDVIWMNEQHKGDIESNSYDFKFLRVDVAVRWLLFNLKATLTTRVIKAKKLKFYDILEIAESHWTKWNKSMTHEIFCNLSARNYFFEISKSHDHLIISHGWNFNLLSWADDVCKTFNSQHISPMLLCWWWY